MGFLFFRDRKMANADSAEVDVSGFVFKPKNQATRESGDSGDDGGFVYMEERDIVVRNQIRKEVEEGLREDLVDDAVNIHYWSQEYKIMKWMRWIWEWCTESD